MHFLRIGHFQGNLLKYHCLDNPENYKKLLMVDLEQPAWDAPDLIYRTQDHWQAVTVSAFLLFHLYIHKYC